MRAGAKMHTAVLQGRVFQGKPDGKHIGVYVPKAYRRGRIGIQKGAINVSGDGGTDSRLFADHL